MKTNPHPEWTFDWETDMASWVPMLDQMISYPGLYIFAGITGSGKAETALRMSARCAALGLPAMQMDEIKDADDWKRAMQVCAGDWRIVATVHASDVQQVRSRLVQLGAENEQLGVLRGVSAQMLVNRFAQLPDDKLVWPQTVLSSYMLFHEGYCSASLPEWDVLVTLRQDAVNKLLRGAMGKNAVDANLIKLKRAQQTMTLAQALADL